MRLVERAILIYLTFAGLLVGVWATLFPQSFYDDFPGAGRVWVSVDGPYNQHLIRDVGALNLALAVVAIVAFVTLSRAAVLAALEHLVEACGPLAGLQVRPVTDR